MDIALATDMLGHAYQDNFGIAVLVAGDGDCVPLVEAVKRRGKRVFLAFFDNGMNPALAFSVFRRLTRAREVSGNAVAGTGKRWPWKQG